MIKKKKLKQDYFLLFNSKLIKPLNKFKKKSPCFGIMSLRTCVISINMLSIGMCSYKQTKRQFCERKKYTKSHIMKEN